MWGWTKSSGICKGTGTSRVNKLELAECSDFGYIFNLPSASFFEHEQVHGVVLRWFNWLRTFHYFVSGFPEQRRTALSNFRFFQQKNRIYVAVNQSRYKQSASFRGDTISCLIRDLFLGRIINNKVCHPFYRNTIFFISPKPPHTSIAIHEHFKDNQPKK